METSRLAGWLLITGGAIALVGACWPPYKQWYSPVEEALRVIDANPGGWRAIHAGFLVGTIVAALGMALLARTLASGPGAELALLAAVGFAMGTVFWSLEIAFRLTVTPWAARALVNTGSIPEVYMPLRRLSSAVFALFAGFTFLSVAAAGASFLRQPMPRWMGWSAVAIGVVGAPVSGLTGPWVVYAGVILLGAGLLRAT